MQQNTKVKPLKQCCCRGCKSYRGMPICQFQRNQANRRIRRLFSNLLRRDEESLSPVQSMDRW